MSAVTRSPARADEAAFWAAAEAWLYGRMRLLLPKKAAAVPQRSWWPWSPAPQPEPAAQDEGAVRAQRAALDAALEADPPPRLARLAATLGLSPFERDVLLTCLLHARNPIFAQLFGQRPECPGGQITFALAMLIATDSAWDAGQHEGQPRLAAAPDWAGLTPDGPLRYWRLVELSQPGSQPLISATLRADEQIVHVVNGVGNLDDRLQPLCHPVAALELSPSQEHMAAEAVRQLEAAGGAGLVQLSGGDGETKALLAAAIAGELGRSLYRLKLAALSAAPGERELLARLWRRDALLFNLALLVEAGDGGEALSGLLPLLDRPGALTFLDSTEPLRGQGAALLLDVARPTAAEQAAAWRTQLGPTSGDRPAGLAAQFSLNLSELAEVAAVAATASPADSLTGDLLGRAAWTICRGRARPRLDGLAQRVVPRVRLSDVQLPEREGDQLERIAAQVRNRTLVYDDHGFRERLGYGLGISALFVGESGTGKTMAAEALAGELELDLYRIDLATVVSKYIGETEKNLRHIFDAAELSGATLLFDEADALFGRRSEVKDSHDRYANIEVGYLLQRMESYGGLAILTSNMRSALDPAFLRRLRFIVPFPLPGHAERRRIWAALLPPAWQAGLDMDALGRPALTGGQIRNIALGGAFLAAAAGEELTMAMLHDAAADELRKSGRPFPATEFSAWLKAPRRAA